MATRPQAGSSRADSFEDGDGLDGLIDDLDEARTSWAQQSYAQQPYAQQSYAQQSYAQQPRQAQYEEQATAYRPSPAQSYEEQATAYRPAPSARASAAPAPAHWQQEERTSYWRGAEQPQQSQPASPRAETYLSAARGGVGRPAASVAAASMAASSMAQQPAPSRAGASSRRAAAPARPAPAPAPRAPSHLPDEDGWSVEERTRLRTEAFNEAFNDAFDGARGGRKPQAAPAAAASPSSPASGDRGPRAVAGELHAHSQSSYSVSSAQSQPAPQPQPKARRSPTAAGSAPRRLPAPPADEPLSQAAPAPAPATPAGPLRIDAPPEVALAAYPLVRRVALQQDLKAADRVLRVGLAELTNATTCRTWYVGADGQLFSLELSSDPSEAEKSLLDQSLAASQPRASGRLLCVPVIAAGKVVALALLGRGEQLAAFAPAELMIAMVVMQETSGFIVQLLIHHAEAQRDLAADAKSIYNPEALASQRKRGHEGGLIHLSPRWVRIAYPSAVLSVLAAIVFAVLAKVPTYSAGAGVITIEGIEITSPSPGSVASVRVQPGQPVRAGEELARLLAQDEESALAQADREYRNALATLLFDGADEATKSAAAAAATARQRAVDRLEARVIRAPQDGIVGDVRVRSGAALGIGDHVLTLLRRDAEPTVLVFLPGQDRPRLRRGQTIQIELSGYTKVRERATIFEVGAEVIGPNEARRSLGQKNADAVPLSGPVVMVRAKLPTRTFKVNRDTFRYHDGMPLRGEVKVENKPFLISLIPALEKAL